MQEHLSSKLLFDSRVCLKDPAAYSWFSQIKTVVELIDNSADINQIRALLKVYASNIKTAVLLSLPHNYSDRIKGRAGNPLPHYIRKATDYIHFNYESSIQLEDIANHTGYSVRSLVEGFRKFVGTSPKKYLTEVRLSAARQKLLDPDCADSVTDIAFMAGFTQLGRFSGLYRDKFGELPSQTRSIRNISWQPPRLLSN